MRGGHLVFAAVWLCLSSCAAPEPPNPKPVSVEQFLEGSIPRLEPEPLYKVPQPQQPSVQPQGSGLPAPEAQIPEAKPDRPGVVPTRAEPAPREPGFEDLLKLQKEIAARHPASDDEKLRLALLYAAAGNLEEAERIFSTVRARTNKMAPYLDFFLRRELGDHKEAGKVLAQFVDEDRRATGFVIQKAELCTQVRRFRDYTAAESDRVKPGGAILLYVEPRNFALQRVEDKHILNLKYEWKLYDDRSTEHPVQAWEQAAPAEREDRVAVNGPITEFYQSFRLPLPVNLAMGRYRVKVTVTDAHSGKSDQVFIPITVTGVDGK